jgi:hypothetical protein
LYGYTDKSNSSKYTYRRKGILTFPNIKLAKSTLLVRKEHAMIIRLFLKKQRVEFSEHTILLTDKEAKTLQFINRSKWIIEDLKGSDDFLVTVDF